MLQLNDDVLLTRAAQGDQEAFGGLYERYVDLIYNYIYYRTGNIHDAEDLTERVFMRAMRHIGNYKDRGLPFSAWLYRIAKTWWLTGIATKTGVRRSHSKRA